MTSQPYIKNLASNFRYMNYATRFIIQFKKKEEDPASQPPENNMIKTTKFESDPRVFLVSNLNNKELLHIADEKTWNRMKKMGFISNEPDEILNPALMPLYNIYPEEISTTFKIWSVIKTLVQKSLQAIK